MLYIWIPSFSIYYKKKKKFRTATFKNEKYTVVIFKHIIISSIKAYKKIIPNLLKCKIIVVILLVYIVL